MASQHPQATYKAAPHELEEDFLASAVSLTTDEPYRICVYNVFFVLNGIPTSSSAFFFFFFLSFFFFSCARSNCKRILLVEACCHAISRLETPFRKEPATAGRPQSRLLFLLVLLFPQNVYTAGLSGSQLTSSSWRTNCRSMTNSCSASRPGEKLRQKERA